jgi:outer membrane protein assembly factor BamB
MNRLCLLLLTLPLMGENWPQFRGPSRQGVSTERGVPFTWSETEGVLWRTAIPGEGWSSPIVWKDRIFLTTATGQGQSARVLCLDAKDGKPLWDRELYRMTPGHKERRNSYATPTPITDGRRVYAVFGDGGAAALDFAGKTVWLNRDYTHYSQHGLGASPILEGGLLILPRDGSSETGDKRVGWQIPWDKGFVLALDAETGKQRWRTGRGFSRIAHVTPHVLTENGRQVLASGAGDVVQGFDLRTGELLWTGRSQGEGVVPSIVLGEGLIFTASGFEKPTIRAFRPGGRGDVTQTHLAWEQTRGVPSIPSFIHLAPHLYAIASNGVASCYRAATGELVNQARIGGEHSASPVLAEGRIYFSSEEGDVTVVEANPQMKVLAVNKLPGQVIKASPAISAGRIYIRTATHVYAIGRKSP